MQGVSSDESEDEHTRTIDYPRVYPRWRSLSLAMIMWQADEVIEENAKIPIGKRKKSGTQLRNRPHSNKFNDNAAAPPGLPCNCYDVKWLASLPSRTLKHLRIQESTYAFRSGPASASDPGAQPQSASTTTPAPTPGMSSMSHTGDIQLMAPLDFDTEMSGTSYTA
ncbi:hypothetical protein M404DRAFT_28563 [Pisolithus tinctorius Marx 270]|uniref:Uncharacterized protein n=1 Tax=Pisolithus tinctorius Marx 270 TaxID=870435 RepID=A0A0C3P2I8_PISTI|nr:hypothetical protein M404DRAFT_28563 [Pisolithus tinctorius Marx 270]